MKTKSIFLPERLLVGRPGEKKKKIKQKFCLFIMIIIFIYYFLYSIGPKIGTLLTLPCRKSTDHGLSVLKIADLRYMYFVFVIG